MKMVRPEKRLISSDEEDLGEVGLKRKRLMVCSGLQLCERPMFIKGYPVTDRTLP